MQVKVGGFGQSGERDQLAHEIASHVTSLRRYALVLVGDPSEADDLVQECLSRVLAQMRSWRPVHDLRAYLFTTLHNVFVDNSRRQKLRRTDVPLDQAIASLSLPANQLKRLEFRDLIIALGKLRLSSARWCCSSGSRGCPTSRPRGFSPYRSAPSCHVCRGEERRFVS